MAIADIADLGRGLHRIDLNFQGQPGVIASYLLQSGGETALIEIGPGSTLPTLLQALAQLKVDPDEISSVVVTHIHLDHAGAAGTFLQRFHHAQLYVHEIGAPHMIDPSRLLSSATRIWGDAMGPLWGAVDPAPSDRVVTLSDGDEIKVGSTTLDALYTPGHASHHLAFFDAEREAIFTGDITGVRLPDMLYVRPPTPPPEVDLELWQSSVDRIRALKPRTLLLTHFGPFSDIERHIDDNMRRLTAWAGVVRSATQAGEERDAIVATVRDLGDKEIAQEHDDPSVIARYELGTPYGMTVDGLLRYWRKHA